MKFKNKHYISKGADSKVNPLLQIFMWQCIDDMPPPKDYLQVFKCSAYDGKQKITHIQEEPEYLSMKLKYKLLFIKASFQHLRNVI